MYEIPFRRLKSFWDSTEKHTHFNLHLLNFSALGRADGALQNNLVAREPVECETVLKHRLGRDLMILGLWRGEGGVLSLLQHSLVFSLWPFFFKNRSTDVWKLIKQSGQSWPSEFGIITGIWLEMLGGL